MKVGVVKIQNTTVTSQAGINANTSQASTTTITTTSNNTTNASCTVTQVLPKLEIPASTTIQIQSSNPSLANATQVFDAMPLADVDVRTYSHVFNFLCLLRCIFSF